MNSESIRVLYVDDETELLTLGKLFLEKEGNFNVDIVVSVREALDLLNSIHYDVIVSDYEMQEMNGIQFLRHLKKTGNQIPFIVFTGRGREEVVIEALNCGADFYIQKGGNPKAQFAELSNKIRYAVSRKQTEKLLKDSEERYRNVVEDQTEFICRFLPDGTHVFVNEAYCRYFGLDRKEIIGTKFKPKMPHKDNQNAGRLISSLNQSNPYVTVEQKIFLPDGSTRWQRWVDRAIFDTNGKLKEYQSVGRDITELKEREEALNAKNYELQAAYEQIASNEEELRQQLEENKIASQALHEIEKKFQGIVHGSPIPQFVIDKDHRIISWNESLEKYSQIKSEEVIGTKLAWKAFYAKERPVLADLILDGSIEKIPEWYTGKYHRSKYVEDAYEAIDFFPYMGVSGVWLYFTASSIMDSDGSVIGAVETLEDITDRIFKEEALKASEEKFRNVVLSVNEAIILQEKSGKIITWNKAAEQIFGVTAMEMIGHTSTSHKWKTIHEDGIDFPEREHPSIHTLENGESCKNVIMGITSANGGFSWVSINTSPLIRQGEPEPYAVVISLLDITERKHAEEELKSSYEQIAATEEELRANLEELNQQQQALEQSKRELTDIIEFLSDATIVIDRDGIVVAWNLAMEEMTGISKDEMIGEGDYAYTIPFYGERRKHLLDLIDLDDNDLKMKYRYVQKKGKTLYAEVFAPALYEGKGAYLWVTGSPIFDLHGNRIGAIESIRDISERKIAEEALHDAVLNWQHTFDSNQDGICLLDANQRIIMCNRTMQDIVCAKNPDDIIGLQCWKVVHGSLGPIHGCPFIRMQSSLKRETMELEIGNQLFVVVTDPILDETHKLIGTVHSIRDITERKELELEMEYHEQELRKYSTSLAIANKKLTLLSSITRHDINNQLTVLMGYLSILEDKQPDSTLDQYFHKASTAAQRILSMIQFTREYELIGVHSPSWQKALKIVDNAVNQAPIGNVIVKNDIPANFEVFADPLFVKVCYNLIDNAVRYAGKITTIRFYLDEKDEDMIMICEDDGYGVPFNEKEQIFERGFGKNTGLGLALSREILDITNIKVRETGEPGKGARFEIIIPGEKWRFIEDSI